KETSSSGCTPRPAGLAASSSGWRSKNVRRGATCSSRRHNATRGFSKGSNGSRRAAASPSTGPSKSTPNFQLPRSWKLGVDPSEPQMESEATGPSPEVDLVAQEILLEQSFAFRLLIPQLAADREDVSDREPDAAQDTATSRPTPLE